MISHGINMAHYLIIYEYGSFRLLLLLSLGSRSRSRLRLRWGQALSHPTLIDILHQRSHHQWTDTFGDGSVVFTDTLFNTLIEISTDFVWVFQVWAAAYVYYYAIFLQLGFLYVQGDACRRQNDITRTDLFLKHLFFNINIDYVHFQRFLQEQVVQGCTSKFSLTNNQDIQIWFQKFVSFEDLHHSPDNAWLDFRMLTLFFKYLNAFFGQTINIFDRTDQVKQLILIRCQYGIKRQLKQYPMIFRIFVQFFYLICHILENN